MALKCPHCDLPEWPGPDKAEAGKDYHEVRFSLMVSADEEFSKSETIGPFQSAEVANKQIFEATKAMPHYLIFEFHLWQRSTSIGWMIGDFVSAIYRQGKAKHMQVQPDKEVRQKRT